jgi:hypothetical protein
MSSFWSDVVSTIIGAGVGAFLAFELERRRRDGEQLREEMGRCHQLSCQLLNRLNTLEDFRDYLFGAFERRERRHPQWDEIPALDGAPDREEPFSFGDFAFLIDGRETDSNAPALLRKLELSSSNMNALLYRLARRNRLWHEWEDAQHEMPVDVENIAALMGKKNALAKSIAELTEWLRTDFDEEIETCRKVFEIYYEVMRILYPREKLLHFRSMETLPSPAKKPSDDA